MKLNGWKRIGIVASVVWIIGAFIVTYQHETKSDEEIAMARKQNFDVLPDEAHDKCCGVWDDFVKEPFHH